MGNKPDNKKKTMVKKKRKLNARGRNAVRKSIAGVLLASSLIVAAIPEDKSGVAEATRTETQGSLSYSSDYSLTQNGNLSATGSIDLGFLNPATASKIGDGVFNSYEVRDDITGSYALIWKYKYYIPKGGVNGSSTGVVSGYNDTYSVDELSLIDDIIVCYDFITNDDFDRYLVTSMFDEHNVDVPSHTPLNNLTFRLDKNPIENSEALNELGKKTELEEVKKYFPDQFATWAALYDKKMADYKSNPSYDPAANPNPTLSEIGCEEFVVHGSDMTAEMKKVYFCYHTGRPGYTLTSVKNLARGSSYVSSYNSTTGDVTTETLPDDDTIYITQVYDSKAVINQIDPNKFKYNVGMTISGIANNAFEKTKNVKKMTVGNSVAYIGDASFKESFIESVNFASVNYIGNEVFKGCQYLSDVNISEFTTVIGKEAFNGCKTLENISIPKGVEQIGFGAFANCPVLRNVDFSNNHGCTIGEYSFYNCPQLKDVTFPTSYDVAIGKAAFALEPGTGTTAAMTEFTFPAGIMKYVSAADNTTSYTNSRIGDYIFANRNNLKTVTMPKNFGTSSEEKIPDYTFSNCIDLECLKFDEQSNSFATFDPELFKDVQNPKMYVYGPPTCTTQGSDGQYYAMPRRATWLCNTQVADYVPYVYYADGRNHYEVGINPYRYELEVNDSDKSAKLLRCEFITDPQDIDLVVPGQVGDYNIKDMESGCFDSLKKYLKSVTVADDSITSIGDNVFSGCEKLEYVDLGNSVTSIGNNSFSDNKKLESVSIGEAIETIGSEAFANNVSLENVTFESPYSYSALTSIGNDAFKTGSPLLYFHGDIVKGYQPFEFAMGPNKISDSTSRRIAYKSLDPTNFTCIKDEETGYVTLIDYPHYCDLPSNVRDHYENNSMNDAEAALLNSTLYISIPDAVESIDVKKFLDPDPNNVNAKNWIYIDDSQPNLRTDKTELRTAIYGNDNLTNGTGSTLLNDFYSEIGGYTAGLFSGEMDETSEIAIFDGMGAGGTPRDTYDTKGNDWILSIEMPGVKYIPDGAFDSCERLESVIIGQDLDSIGTAAFQNCEKLTTIGTNNNPRYEFDNYILYDVNPDGTYTLDTCLPSRGENRSSDQIWVNSDNDPNLLNTTQIAPGAFQTCEYITKVDLEDTNLKSIPTKAFNGCTNLSDVRLPQTITSIAKESFNNGANALDIVIPSNSQISDEAFDKDSTVTIWTYPESTITASYNPVGYDRIYIKYLNSEYTITFLNDDLTIYDRIPVDAGKNGFYPDKNPTPKLTEHAGYTFSYWYFDNPKGIKDVTESRQALAVFVKPESPSNNSANGGNGNGGNGNGSNGNNSNSPSKNSASNNSASNNAVKKFNVVVENGAGSGSYEPGKVVTITAYAPSNGMVFDKWTTSNSDIGFSNQSAVSTTFIMPTHDVKVTATYKNANSTSNNSVSNNKTNNNNNNNKPNGNSPSGNNANNKGDKGGTTVKVTTESIDNSKKNLASATVAGSTDNFVVKVTDSAAASAEVEQALKAKYGDRFDNIKYVAFDISLYDSTGTYLIENSDKLAVTITLPIPDELVSYAGNNKAAVVINGQLDDKAVKFTTIDGVPCMTFVATHFSPYTIYVDTGNLTGGTPDSTPKTGDGINPKWFLSIALAGLSGFMFLYKEKKKKPRLA